MPSKAAATKPLPLSDTLRDLALIRASDIDLALILEKGATSDQKGANTSELDATLERSYEFVREARMAIKLTNRGDVDVQGEAIGSIRDKLENVSKGLAN